MFYSTNCAPKLILVNSPIDDSVPWHVPATYKCLNLWKEPKLRGGNLNECWLWMKISSPKPVGKEVHWQEMKTLSEQINQNCWDLLIQLTVRMSKVTGKMNPEEHPRIYYTIFLSMARAKNWLRDLEILLLFLKYLCTLEQVNPWTKATIFIALSFNFQSSFMPHQFSMQRSMLVRVWEDSDLQTFAGIDIAIVHSLHCPMFAPGT